MRDSVTYMAIVEEGIEKGIEQGRIDEARRLVLRLGRKNLGPPTKKTVAALTSLDDIDRLERLLEHLGDVKSWKALLAVK